LTHVAEGERAQKRAERRRGRDPAAQQPARAPRPQDVGVVDAVGAQHHRVDERDHLAARPRRARPIPAQSHQPLRERLDPKPLGERGDQRDPGVRDRPLIIKRDLHTVQSDRPVILHHEGDLLTQDTTAPNGRFLPAQEVILCPRRERNAATAAVDGG
jgi:hypothetical protein